MNNEQESSTSTEMNKGTTALLFGDTAAEEAVKLSGEDKPKEASPPEPAQVSESELEVPQKEQAETKGEEATEKDEDKEVDEYLSLEDFGNKKVKSKIGGEEKTVTLKELLKGYQTDQYLSVKGQKLAEEYKRLQAVKELSQQSKASPDTAMEVPEDDEIYREYVAPVVARQNKEVETLRTEIENLQKITGPLQYQNNLSAVDKDLRGQGYTDFMEHVPEIEKMIFNMPIEQQVAFDTSWGFTSLYKDIKLAEMQQTINSSKKESNFPDKRPAPKVVNVEGGTNASTNNDDAISRYQAAWEKATQSGSTADWAEVAKLKFAQ